MRFEAPASKQFESGVDRKQGDSEAKPTGRVRSY